MTSHEPYPILQPSEDALLRLPFDQYGRYLMVQEAVATAAEALGIERLALLDVGGYYQEADGTPRLPSQQFLGEHDLTVLDLPPCDLPGYVQGDGTNMQFADSSFDLVVCCDTLEHIPPALRDTFIKELVRVARYGVVLICPIDDYRTALAEKVLYAYIHAELHAWHDQLREHREYGLPQRPLVRESFAGAGCELRDYPSGDLHAWLPMMLAKHYLLKFGQSQPELQFGLDELYNRSYAYSERREPSYRRLIVAVKDDQHSWFEAVDDALAPTVAHGSGIDPARWHGLSEQVLALFQIGQDDRREELRAQMLQTYIEGQRNHVANLDGIIANQQNHVSNLDRIIADQQMAIQHQQNQMSHLQYLVGLGEDKHEQLREHIADLEQRATWLQGQADEARRQLEAVQNGAVMKVVKRFGR
ncbi:MAG: methyltransferase domain-containing protein [Roseiflexaceae bacterium]|nr:methyltransferase domain-containing protein [Roseiflexaceae bacterium]